MRAIPLLAAVAAGLTPFAVKAEPPSLSTPPVAIISELAAPAPVTIAPEAAVRAEALSRPAPAVAPRPKAPTLVARINLATQRLDVHAGGRLQESWAISSGTSEFPTPRGVFRPQWASKMWYSKKYDNAPMPHAVFFSGGAAVHATTSLGMLGQPASHGCVRLAPAHASRFYDLVHKHGFHNSRIEVFGTPPAPRIARRSAPALVRSAALAAAPRHANSWGGWNQPAAQAPSWGATPPVVSRRSAGNVVYLPPGSPFQGQASFVHNGVTYVRVR